VKSANINYIEYGGFNMKTWIADKETLYFHIAEKFKRWKNNRSLFLLQYGTKEDMIQDCWMESVTSKYPSQVKLMEMYDGRIVTEWMQNKIIRKRVSVAVEAWVRRAYAKQKTKNKQESIDMKKKYYQHIEWEKLTRRSFYDVLSSITISKEENIIMLWKMDLIDDKDAMEGLECSERTLYNRWDKLKDKFREALVADPLKSLELFSRVQGIRADMMEMQGE